MEEVWKEVPGFPAYQVSNTGLVRSFTIRGTSRIGDKPRVLRGGLAGAGYLHLTLCSNGSRRQEYFHRLVAFAFLGDPPHGKTEVNHKDGNKTNNRVDNLEWVTSSENGKHKYRIGLQSGWCSHCGERHPRSKLTQQQARAIRQEYANGAKIRPLSRKYGVDRLAIKNIIQGKSYKEEQYRGDICL